MRQRVDPAEVRDYYWASGKGIVRLFVFNSAVVHDKSKANFSMIVERYLIVDSYGKPVFYHALTQHRAHCDEEKRDVKQNVGPCIGQHDPSHQLLEPSLSAP
jgi:hypothetical protein